MLKMRSKSKAFTLIELLIVIAIIGILVSIILVSLARASAKARDATRKQEVEEMQKALELYASEHSHQYPYNHVNGCAPGVPNCTACDLNKVDVNCNIVSGVGTVITNLTQAPYDYIRQIPDALKGENYDYYYQSDGGHYMILVRLEGLSETCTDDTFFWTSPEYKDDIVCPDGVGGSRWWRKAGG